MIWLYVALAGVFGFAIGYFTRGFDDAERFEHMEADLQAARRAARERDFNLQQKGL